MNYAGSGLILLSNDLLKTLLVHDTRSGKWGFPKGHREPQDSSDIETATRECYEETGLKPDDYTIQMDSFKVSKGSQSYNFRYAVIKEEKRNLLIKPGPAYEIAAVQWVPVKQLLDASNVLDGNKYLRTWISDIQLNASKKSVHLFKALIQHLPSMESGGSGNVAVSS